MLIPCFTNLACVASVSVLPSPPLPPPFFFWLSPHFPRRQNTENVPRSFFAPRPYGNACYAGYHKLSWKDLNSQRQIQKALMVFKSLNGLVPEYLTSKFVPRNVSNYALRDSANKLAVPFPRTNYMKNSFSYSGATLWNSLHHDIRESSSLDQFKRLLYQNFLNTRHSWKSGL